LYGAPVVGQEVAGGRSSVYRFHLDSPIPFTKSLRATIEHGHADDRGDNFYSVCYWYQTQPYTDFPPLPAATLTHLPSSGSSALAPDAVARPNANASVKHEARTILRLIPRLLFPSGWLTDPAGHPQPASGPMSSDCTTRHKFGRILLSAARENPPTSDGALRPPSWGRTSCVLRVRTPCASWPSCCACGIP